MKEAEDQMIEEGQNLIEDTISFPLRSGIPHKVQLKTKSRIKIRNLSFVFSVFLKPNP